MQKSLFGILALIITVFGFSIAPVSAQSTGAVVSGGEIKQLIETLESNKNLTLEELSLIKTNLEKEIGEMSKIRNITLFKATTCLGVFDDQSTNYDLETMIKQKRDEILNHYIQLNADLQRLGYGILTEKDETEHQIKNFFEYHQKSLQDRKVVYQDQIQKIIKDFLAYVENNKELLGKLADKMDILLNFEAQMSPAQDAFQEFESLLNRESDLSSKLQEAGLLYQSDFEKSLEKIWEQFLENNPQLNATTQSSLLGEKQNIQQQFAKENEILKYHIFSAIFSYKDYLDLLTKKEYLLKNYYTANGSIDCMTLLEDKKDPNLSAQNSEKIASKLTQNLKLLNSKIKEKNVSFKAFVDPMGTLYQNMIRKVGNTQLQNFSNLLQSKDSSTSSTLFPNNQTSNQTPTTQQKSVFTTSFSKNSYHEQIKLLQKYLQDRGYYHGTINGKYDDGTISAVYQLQLKEGIISGNEKDKSSYGWFGPATRAKVNSKIAK